VQGSASSRPPRATWLQEGRVLRLAGRWHRDAPTPVIEGKAPAGLPEQFDCSELEEFDSTLPAFLLARARTTPGSCTWQGLPDNLRGLMQLALSVPEQSDARAPTGGDSLLNTLGKWTLHAWEEGLNTLTFLGESIQSLGRFVTGRARFRARDFWETLQQCGAEALPIVALISFLVGLILAFVGNVQLANFGANIFVADLVAIAMVREMGVMMTAIIMSGRTGAAFAAHLGSMQANEEIDALRTFGLHPFDFLVLPRLLALLLMMPLLTIYSNLIGILGGMLVGFSVGIPPVLYWNETLGAVTLTTASLGVFKSFFFGAAIAVAGCMTGMNAGRSSAAVGEATTRAVVASITAVIVLDSAFAAIFTVLDI
jgi:phospholipid/cholesterol/gamma-HCH transport system permease protein